MTIAPPQSGPELSDERSFLVEEYKLDRIGIHESTKSIAANYVYAASASAAVAAWWIKEGFGIGAVSQIAPVVPFCFALALFLLSIGIGRRMRQANRRIEKIEDWLLHDENFRPPKSVTEEGFFGLGERILGLGRMEQVSWVLLLILDLCLARYGISRAGGYLLPSTT